MIHEIQLKVLPQEAASEQDIKRVIAREQGISLESIRGVQTLKRSIDARQRTVYVNLKVLVYCDEPMPEPNLVFTPYPDVSSARQAIVVGAGPGGLFAALRLVELGIKPIVVERGKNVRDRKRDIALISREHAVNPESNYCFGEGGAGAYSDGKLYTRSKKRGSVERILTTFCRFGASPSILVDAHPHIGTDKLPRVIENMRNELLRCGGEVHFNTRMDRLILDGHLVRGIVTQDGREFLGPVILATGHSARDVYQLLHDSNIAVETKAMAVGVRLEHPQHLIDQLQYHSKEGRGAYLPAAEYSMVTQVRGRGVYSFCMCPGGFVVPAASDREQLVVNGMSPSDRGSRWANSGMVVEVRPEDLPHYASHGDLMMMKFQDELEYQCYLNGQKSQTAPAQCMDDFLRGKISAQLPESSYSPGILSSSLHTWLPPFIGARLQEGLAQFGVKTPGFITNQAVLIGVESRTSSPVRIVRDKDSFQHSTVEGLFPCGEGAGYAGGIVSAAIDGERCAEGLARLL